MKEGGFLCTERVGLCVSAAVGELLQASARVKYVHAVLSLMHTDIGIVGMHFNVDWVTESSCRDSMFRVGWWFKTLLLVDEMYVLYICTHLQT